MFLHYERKNFFWFKGLRVKKSFLITKDLKILDEKVNSCEYLDNRNRVLFEEKKTHLLNLYMGKYIIKIMDFIKDKENIKITPWNIHTPLTFSVSNINNFGLKIHYDTSKIDTIIYKRYYGFHVYLNDNYEGGEVVFPLLDLKIKPNAGDLFFFRSNVEFPHYSKKVINGEKWMAQGYFKVK